MKLWILAVGTRLTGPEKALFDEYADRFRKLGPQLGLRKLTVIDVASGPTPDAEAERLLAKLPSGATALRLDEHGENLPSEKLAHQIGQWRDRSVSDLVFLIGGASGFGEAILKKCPNQIAFGAQTWPHRLVKIMLSEQLYRAATLLAGHPYHKA
ncbi:MAG: 23S rRNA (pseudouridine(1915)-N(3))-methyltransferase RlmH [Pseudomonadota bacterium]